MQWREKVKEKEAINRVIKSMEKIMKAVSKTAKEEKGKKEKGGKRK